MIRKFSILRNFYNYSAPELVPFASNVASNLDPLKFPNLPFSPAEVQSLADDLKMKQAAMVTGGTVATAAKNVAFQALADALDKNAHIVEVVAGADLELLLSTGYLPASTNRASGPLNHTSIVSLENNGSTSLLLRLQPVTNAKSYQVQLSTDGGKTWVEACIATQARRVVLNGLVPGTVYFVRARAIGGSTGSSDWSGSTSIMCT